MVTRQVRRWSSEPRIGSPTRTLSTSAPPCTPAKPWRFMGSIFEFKILSSERTVAVSGTAHCSPPGRRLRRGLFL